MHISDLSCTQLRARCHGDGLRFRAGDFAVRLQTRLEPVIDGIGLMYADFPLQDEDQHIDFHIALDRPPTLRRWLRPQVRFLLDGQSPFQPLPLAQSFPMFEWGLNWCVSAHANSFLMIHAAVVEHGGLAAILPAPPGSGKSTLCAALVQHGWRLLSDELALVRLADGAMVPMARPVSLKNGSIDLLRQYAPAAVLSAPVSDTVKGTVAHLKPPQGSVARGDLTCRPGWVVFPRYVPGADALMAPLPRAHAFMQVADNAFNYSMLGQRGFGALADVIDASACFEFSYSRLDDAVAAFDALHAAAQARAGQLPAAGGGR
jgi:HprK-related kinase A